MNEPNPDFRRLAMAVVKAMAANLQHQHVHCLLTHCGKMDDSGFINVSGTIDLSQLAFVTEDVMRRMFW